MPHALILGAGVSGLTTAVCLRRCGIQSTIIADQFAPAVASAVAGALWEWPPVGYGANDDSTILRRSKAWAARSYREFDALAADGDTGVYLRPATFFFRSEIARQPHQLAKIEELPNVVKGFSRDRSLVERTGVNTRLGFVDAYEHISPMIEMDTYLRWLMRDLQSSGVRIVRRMVIGDLIEQETQLRAEFGADVIMNCTGLGSRHLTNDDMYPVRGAMIRLINDGHSMPLLKRAYIVPEDQVTARSEVIVVLPRGKDRVVLGAIAEANAFDTDISIQNHAPLKRMHERCVEFLPVLRHARLDGAEPLRTGLRPFRRHNVRVEKDPAAPVIHNYGHGGAGVTFSWGCGVEAAEMALNMTTAPSAAAHLP